MSNISESALRNAIAELSPSQAERSAAERALRRMRLEVTNETVEIYLGMKALKPSGHIKAPNITDHVKKEVVGTSEISVTVWIIRKSDFPNLPEKINKKFLKDPASLKNLPSAFAPANIWVVSQGVPKNTLMEHMERDEILEWKTALAEVETTLLGSGADDQTPCLEAPEPHSTPPIDDAASSAGAAADAACKDVRKKQANLPTRFLAESGSETDTVHNMSAQNGL